MLMTANDGKATKTSSMFRMECAVSIAIPAKPERIWSILTNAREFARWNSTLQSVEGAIALGQTVQLRTKATPDRVFKLKVTTFEPPSRMVWQDGGAPMFQGIRTYSLTPQGDKTLFLMSEVFSGLMMPMIKGSLPDFGPVFEQYAADLKREAERQG
jgi:uncharacterized protein YndB with AHSA1/START domain